MNETSTMQKINFSIEAKLLIDALKTVGGIIENTQVIPILSHVKLEIHGDFLTALASDSEIEMNAVASLAEKCEQNITIAVSCKKLLDICKTFASNDIVSFSISDGWLCVESQQSKFMLATLPAENFPKIIIDENSKSMQIPSTILHKLMQNTAFAMAEQDVRFFLNGLHLSIDKDFIHVAATDGHRLASAETSINLNCQIAQQCIIPKKATQTLIRLLNGMEDDLTLTLSANHIKVSCSQFAMTSNLIEGSKIDCQQLIPNKQEAVNVNINPDLFKQALSRAAILSHEKFKGAKISFKSNCMNIMAHNAEQEKTEENIAVQYEHKPIEMAFNINYMQDLLNVVKNNDLTWYFLPEQGIALVEDNIDNIKFIYVVMSMHI